MARYDSAVGRYLYLEVDGIEYRVYYEESGTGIPLLLQHTAASDGRLWRHLLADSEIQKDFRMIAYDLPYHGKSLPPVEVRWWEQEYLLHQDFLMNFVVAFSKELGLERPAYMGCSMGGHLAPDLALYYPDEFRAVIGVEAAIVTPHHYYVPWWHHPRISDDSKPALMYGFMAPSSPEKYRRETVWTYSQAAPGMLKGDLYYYSVEHDLTGKAHKIDTAKCAVYLLTGEYDWASTPEMSEALANEIRGAKFVKMSGLGHFAMSENPELFRTYLMPVLREIKDLSRRGVRK